MVSLAQFQELVIKVALVTQVTAHPHADRLYVVRIDTGGVEKEVVAGIRPAYSPEALTGKQIVVVDNLEPATIRGVTSQGMLLAASDPAGIAVLVPDRPVAIGSRVK